MKVSVGAFSGIRPALSSRLLQDNEAQLADNCLLESGEIRQIAQPMAVNSFSLVGMEAFMLYDLAGVQKWLAFTDEGTRVVPGHLHDDTHGRCYMTDLDGPRMFTKTEVEAATFSSNKLGIPAPTATPAGSVSGTGSGDAYTTAYVFTLVSEYGEEGAPSPASDLFTVTPGQSVDLTGLNTPDTTDYNTIEYKRIYRLNTGTSGSTEYQFVADIPVADTTYSDTVASADLGEVLPSTDWYEPPAGLSGLAANGGLYAGFDGRDLWYCEPGFPHAWPLKYNTSVEADIVGHAFTGDYQVVLTEGKVYIVDCTDITYAVPMALKGNTPCMSAKGIASTKLGVIFPGQDGLYIVAPSSTSAINITKPFFSERDWKELNPASMVGIWHLDKYFCFYEDLSGNKRGLLFDFTPEGIAMVRGLSFHATAAYVEPDGNYLYLAYESTSGRTSIMQWEGSILTYRASWRSKVFRTASEVNMAAAMVVADFRDGLSAEAFEARKQEVVESYSDFIDAGEFYGEVGSAGPGEYVFAGDALGSIFINYEESPQIIFRLYGDGEAKHTQEISSDTPFNLPGGYTANDWYFEIVADVPVSQVSLATSMMELLD
jgi:hypothetical protein